MAEIATNRIQIGSDTLVLNDAQARQDVADLKSAVDEVVFSHTFTGTAGWSYFNTSLNIGDRFEITNNTSGATTIRLRDGSNTVLESFDIGANTSSIFTSNVNCTNVGVYFNAAGTIKYENLAKRLPLLESAVDTVENNIKAYKYKHTIDYSNPQLFEDGHYKTSDGTKGTPPAETYYARFRTKGFLPSATMFIASKTSFRVFRYSSSGVFDSVIASDVKTYSLYKSSDYKYKIDVYRSASNTDWTNDANNVLMLSDNEMYDSPFYRVLDKTYIAPNGWFSDSSTHDENFGTSTDYSTFISAVDSLVSASNGYITKATLGQDSDSKNIYSLSLRQPHLSDQKYGSVPKIIIVAGQQGIEKANIFGLYYFIKNLVLNSASDPVLHFIKSNIDLEIIPCVSPWGFNNNKYYNKNGVSLNRNYSVPNWEQSDPSDPDEYTGSAPFSEPETVIVRDFVLSNTDAITVIDFHTFVNANNTAVTDMNWHNYYSPDDMFFGFSLIASRNQIQNWTTWIKEKYDCGVSGSLSGTLTLSTATNKGSLAAWASLTAKRCGMTFEGIPGFYPEQQTYTDNVYKANCESIGNWIGELLRVYLA